jgi:hypothetical protein
MIIRYFNNFTNSFHSVDVPDNFIAANHIDVSPNLKITDDENHYG